MVNADRSEVLNLLTTRQSANETNLLSESSSSDGNELMVNESRASMRASGVGLVATSSKDTADRFQSFVLAAISDSKNSVP